MTIYEKLNKTLSYIFHKTRVRNEVEGKLHVPLKTHLLAFSIFTLNNNNEALMLLRAREGKCGKLFSFLSMTF